MAKKKVKKKHDKDRKVVKKKAKKKTKKSVSGGKGAMIWNVQDYPNPLKPQPGGAVKGAKILADALRKKLGMKPRPGSKGAKELGKFSNTRRKQQKKLEPIRKAARRREARRKNSGRGGVGRRSG